MKGKPKAKCLACNTELAGGKRSRCPHCNSSNIEWPFDMTSYEGERRQAKRQQHQR